MVGVLKIRPVEAFISDDKDALGKMDAYVKVTVGSQEHKTAIAKGMGKTPAWKDELVFNIGNEQEVKVELWDDDIGPDDFLGKVVIPLKDIAGHGIVEKNFVLVSRILHSQLGTIHLRLEYH